MDDTTLFGLEHNIETQYYGWGLLIRVPLLKD
jgi:hypothetical protein